MGYLSNQAGIMRRFLREEGSWESHLANSRKTILEAFHEVKPKKIAFLGSGWLLDIPLKELLDAGAEVSLFDIAHPSPIRHKFRDSKNLKFIDYDLTQGGVEVAWVLKRRKKENLLFPFENLQNKENQRSFDLSDFDLIVSSNILSQLHFHIVEFLLKKSLIRESQGQNLILTFQENHLRMLPQGKSLLITDYDEELFENGKLIGVNPRVFCNLNDLWKICEWQWIFDTHKSYAETTKVVLNVRAFRI